MDNNDTINIEGAQENNLKDISVKIPKNKIVVITGVSGSGKSSLAFDTVYAEGYRRYVENLSSYARFFLKSARKPKVKKITNLSPAIAIDQKSGTQNPRSTVGTLTDIYDFFRYLYAQVGVPHCPYCNLEMKKQDVDGMIEQIKKMEENTQLAILAVWPETQKTTNEIIATIEGLGYARIRVEGRVYNVREINISTLFPNEKGGEKPKEVQVVVDRLTLHKRQFDRERIIDSLQTAVDISKGQAVILVDNQDEITFNKYYICPQCRFTIKRIKPKNFSFNSPDGACSRCAGLGSIALVDVDRVLPNKNLSINEGAIIPWSRSGGRGNGEGYYKQILDGLAKKYGFSLNKAISKLPKKALEGILFGTKGEEFEIKDKGIKKNVVFEGVVNYLEDKYKKAESSFVRNEIEKYMTIKTCPHCQGKRLKEEFLSVKVFGKAIDETVHMEISDLFKFLDRQQQELAKGTLGISEQSRKVSAALIQEILNRVAPLEEVGLGYLNLDRSCQSLSGGEFQRTRLATQLYSGLSNVVYVLDEPSIGLHSRDNQKLVQTLKKIKSGNNSVIVVEHDREIIKSADYVIDIGPGAGDDGGEIIFEGSFKELKAAKTETSLYIKRKKTFSRRNDKSSVKEKLVIKGATENNLKNLEVEIPLKKLVVVAGVSGSGKSSLVNDILAKALRKRIMGSFDEPGAHKSIEGAAKISKVVIVDQSPIGRSPRSNAATYTGVFSHIRDIFAQTQIAKERGYNASYFSFNMRGGRCEYCQGEGTKRIEMHLLDDVYAVCPHCHGSRYSKKILDVQYHGVNIADVLDMNIEYANNFFSSHKLINDKLEALCKVGLGYLKLGQSATELSGGEAQRIKLASELSRKSSGSSLYLLDEPTIGLHFSDIAKLLKVLQDLVDKGNSVIVVEHNLDVIDSSDWVVELGPEGGNSGGELVFQGTPEQLKKAKTWTGKALAENV